MRTVQLADALDDDTDRRVRHRAAAAVAPDEDVAAALVEVAERAKARGAFDEAARLTVRAADLTPDPSVRAGRMLDAIATTLPTGNLGVARGPGHPATQRDRRPAGPGPGDPLPRLCAGPDPPAGRRTCGTHRGTGSAGRRRHRPGWGSLTALAVLVYQSGSGVETLREWYQRYLRQAPDSPYPESLLIEAAQAWIRMVMDPLDRPPDLLRLVHDHLGDNNLASGAGHRPRDDDRRRGLAAGGDCRGQPAPASRRGPDAALPHQRPSSARRCAHSRRSSSTPPTSTAPTGPRRMLADLGEAEAIALDRDAGLAIRSRVAAVRGDIEAAKSLAEEVLFELEIGQFRVLEAGMRQTYGYLHFSEHDMDGCYDQLRSLFHNNGTPLHEHVSYRALADLVAAAVRTGRADEDDTTHGRGDQATRNTRHSAPARAGQGSCPAGRRRGRGVPCPRHRRRRGLPVALRPGQRPPRVRRVAAPPAPAHRRPRLPAGRRRRLRPTRRARLVRARPHRAPRRRGLAHHGSGHAVVGRADRPGTRSGPARGHGHDQPRDRRLALSLAPHRRRAPLQRLSQARRHRRAPSSRDIVEAREPH